MVSDFCMFFFFNDTATTEIYTLSLHDALPIFWLRTRIHPTVEGLPGADEWASFDDLYEEAESFTALYDRIAGELVDRALDRKSTRLNSSHANISYAVFCLKKKNNTVRSQFCDV